MHIAEGQRTLVTHRQLAQLGLSCSAISRAAIRGRLFRVHRGVYSVVAAALRPPWTVELAALLACGEAAVLSHQTAAHVHGILPAGSDLSTVHVTLNGGERKARRSGIRLHTTQSMHRDDHHPRIGLRVTSVARTVIDLSPSQPHRQREVLVDQALKKTSRTKLNEAVARHSHRPGVPALRGLLDPSRASSLTRSRQEERLRQMIPRSGLPMPETNVELYNGYFPDLLWRAQGLILEYDSEEHHLGIVAFHDDRTRHNRLEADGYRVLHVTKEHLAHPERVLVWIAQALIRV